MAKNPFAFHPAQVTTLVVLLVLAVFIPLLYVHHVVPTAPSSPAPVSGVNLTEAWLDLKEISNGFHPYNSRRNDQVHDFLLAKVESIIKRNKASVAPDGSQQSAAKDSVIISNDLVSNLTVSNGNVSVYFEGTNIIVYVPGTDGPETSGILVNAHYDSVSTGFGATDDGMGVVTILQLLSHFTQERPKRGIVFLLNNGEEDYLNGAYAFMRNPLSQYAHMFLNLEGAGAGGRAVMFRSTDAQVTKFYQEAAKPFGSVLIADGFDRGFVRSQTDYIIFNGQLGLRGLDVAFFEPRARYHTIQDSTKFDSLNSLWHMMSNSLGTVTAMTSDTGSEFDGDAHDDGKVSSGSGSPGVWFDVFGQLFAVFELHTVFAVSVTLLVATPILLLLLTMILAKVDRWYPFARTVEVELDDGEKTVDFGGWRGVFRYPTAFIVSTGALVGLCFLQTKINPNIAYSSEYAVWAMFVSTWVCFEWVILFGSYHHRPTALGRFHALFWMYIGSYVLLAATAVGQNNLKIAGSYFIVIYFTSVWLAFLASYLELFALPKMDNWAQTTPIELEFPSYTSQPPSRPLTSGSYDETAAEDATESTSLLRGERSGYNTYSTQRRSSAEETEASVAQSEGEQPWSFNMPKWTWVIQLLLLFPVNAILIGQVALLLTSALHQTTADGNPVIVVYFGMAAFTVLILSPLRPFLHKLSYRVWWFLALVFAGTLIYNLLAFPFSANARLKFYFIQRVDLDTGTNAVSLLGLDGHVQDIIAELPSAAGQPLDCTAPSISSRRGLAECKWSGLAPDVVKSATPSFAPGTAPPRARYTDWLNYTAARVGNETNTAVFKVSGRGTRACKLLFDTAVSSVHVAGGAADERFKPVGERGSVEVRLWSRTWDRTWEVTVKWDGAAVGSHVGTAPDSLTGRVVCMWSDANDAAAIPALEEVWRFAPAWSIVTKASDGLVEGSRSFVV